MSLSPDYKRIAMMEKNIADIQAFFDANAKGKAKLLFKHQFKKHYFILPPPWRILWRMRSASKRMVPDFCSTGVIRSGTSSMSNYILQHPAVVMPLSKELGALSPRLNAIKAQFPLVKEAEKVRNNVGHAITGDCTPILPGMTQLYWMKALNPDMKYVITLRDPVARTLSHWRWHKMITRVYDDDPLWQAMPGMEESLQHEMNSFADGDVGYITFCGATSTGFVRQSCYLPFLQKLYQEVPEENIMIVTSEELFADAQAVSQKVYSFLGLPEYQAVDIKETNPSQAIDIPEQLTQDLQTFFKPHNEKLYEFLNRDLGWQ